MPKTKLVDIADIKLSNVDKKSNPNETTVKLCNYTDVYKNAYITKDMIPDFMVATAKAIEIEKFSVKKNQVAITKDSETPSDIGISACIAEDLDGVVLGYHLALITPDETKLDGRFLNYYFSSSQIKKYFEYNAGGSGQRCSLSLDCIHSIPVELPNLSEQKSISKTLSLLDEKIALNKKTSAKLEKVARDLYDYWFIQFDFPDDYGRPYKTNGGEMVWSEELKREIPKSWDVKKVGALLQNVDDASLRIESKDILSFGLYPVITQDAGGLIKGYTNETRPIKDVPILVFGDHSCTLRYINFPFLRGADGTQLMKFREIEMTNYTYFWLDKIMPQITNYGKYERHYKYLKELSICLPTSGTLKSFSAIIQPSLQMIRENNKQSVELSSLRNWLLPMLMNGQIKIS